MPEVFLRVEDTLPLKWGIHSAHQFSKWVWIPIIPGGVCTLWCSMTVWWCDVRSSVAVVCYDHNIVLICTMYDMSRNLYLRTCMTMVDDRPNGWGLMASLYTHVLWWRGPGIMVPIQLACIIVAVLAVLYSLLFRAYWLLSTYVLGYKLFILERVFQIKCTWNVSTCLMLSNYNQLSGNWSFFF